VFTETRVIVNNICLVTRGKQAKKIKV